MDCIFCRIAAGEIPCVKVHETETTITFMDINPLTEGHLLVVPKAHVETLFDAEAALLADVMDVVSRVARAQKAVLGNEGLNLVQANGKAAFQSVPHLHFHLIPRRPEDGAGFDWIMTPGDTAAIEKHGARIAQAIG